MSEVTVYERPDEESTAIRCHGCGEWCTDSSATWFTCDECVKRYPPALMKAVCDPYDYALRLVTGEIVYFSEATISGEWVHLDQVGQLRPVDSRPFDIPAPRGVDIRVDSIVWVTDAPHGS